MKRLLISDLDGTLIDTFPDLYFSAVEALKSYGVPIRHHSPEDARAYAGTGAIGLLSWLKESSHDGDMEQLCKRMVEIYGKNLIRESRPFPGTESWFERFRVAVVTNKPRYLSEPLLEHFFPGKYTFLATPDEVGEKKPSPRLYQRVMEELKEEPIWVIGDDLRDYEAALPLKLPFLIAAYGYYPPGTWDPYPELPRLTLPRDLLDITRRKGERNLDDFSP